MDGLPQASYLGIEAHNYTTITIAHPQHLSQFCISHLIASRLLQSPSRLHAAHALGGCQELLQGPQELRRERHEAPQLVLGRVLRGHGRGAGGSRRSLGLVGFQVREVADHQPEIKNARLFFCLEEVENPLKVHDMQGFSMLF